MRFGEVSWQPAREQNCGSRHGGKLPRYCWKSRDEEVVHLMSFIFLEHTNSLLGDVDQPYCLHTSSKVHRPYTVVIKVPHAIHSGSTSRDSFEEALAFTVVIAFQVVLLLSQGAGDVDNSKEIAWPFAW